jgi:hypothetical protein
MRPKAAALAKTSDLKPPVSALKARFLRILGPTKLYLNARRPSATMFAVHTPTWAVAAANQRNILPKKSISKGSARMENAQDTALLQARFQMRKMLGRNGSSMIYSNLLSIYSMTEYCIGSASHSNRILRQQ